MPLKNPINILCCSTRQWNPGDEWIATGIRNLLTGLYPHTALNWVLYDRSPDCFQTPWQSPERRPGLMANSLQPNGHLPRFDLAIAAGTPEWRGPHLDPVLAAAPPVPWMFLGIDHVHDAVIEPTTQELAIWPSALFVTRSVLGSEALRPYGITASVLPCPSLFAAHSERPARRLETVGVVLQSDRIVNQNVPSPVKTAAAQLVRKLSANYRVIVICNYIDEFIEFQETLDVPVRYSYNSADYQKIIGECDVVVSTRLHSALLANSLLKPAVLIYRNRRTEAAAGLFPYVSVVDPDEVPGHLAKLNFEDTGRKLLNWKRSVEQQYKTLLIEKLHRYGLYCI